MDQNQSPPQPQIIQRPVPGGSPLKQSGEGAASEASAHVKFRGEEQYYADDVGVGGAEGSAEPELQNTHLKSQTKTKTASKPEPRAVPSGLLRKPDEPHAYDPAQEQEWVDEAEDGNYEDADDQSDEIAQEEGASAGDVTSLLGVDGTGDNKLNDLKREGSGSSSGKGSQLNPASPPATVVYNASVDSGGSNKSPRNSVDNDNGSIKSNNSDEPNPKASKSGSNFSGSHEGSGIQVFKNDLGAISFKLPGKITHKTTIKLAHYPQPGTEIINIENPPPCMPPLEEECPIPLPESEFGGEEVCFAPPEEDPTACCMCPFPAGNFTNNCNFCTYNVGQSDQASGYDPSGCGGYGVSNYPSPYTLMQHSLHMQQQIQHQRMQQQRQQYQQLSQSYFSAFNANNIFRQYYPGAGAQSFQPHQNAYGGYGGYNRSQTFHGLGHGQGHGRSFTYGHGGC